MKKLTIHERVLRAVQKRYPDWDISISGVRRKRGKKRTYTISMIHMMPKGNGWRLGGTDENWTITI